MRLTKGHSPPWALFPAFLLLALFAGCGSGTRVVQNGADQPLSGDAVARVGDDIVVAETVHRIARDQGISLHDALTLAVENAVIAEAARRHGLSEDPAVKWATRSILANRMLHHISEDVVAKGPPRDDEVALLTERHWRDVDVGESVRVIHAVALRPTPPDPSKAAADKQWMEHLQVPLAEAPSDTAFESIANAAKDAGVELRVERLSAFQEDGRTVEGSVEQMDPAFVRAAFALHAPQNTSPVIETPFGWHVIRLLGRLPPKHSSMDDRRAVFSAEVYERRSGGLMGKVLREARGATSVEISPAIEALLLPVVQAIEGPP